MGQLTNHTQERLLEHLFGVVSFLSPTLYCGLSTTAPTVTGGSVTEPSGMGYARVGGVTWNPVTQTLYASDTPKGASSHSTTNASPLVFPAATGTWTSGSTLHAVFYDDPGAGNLVFYTQLNTVGGPVTSGKVVTIPAGGVTISIPRASSTSWTATIYQTLLQHLLSLVTYTPPTWYLGLVTALNIANETYTEFADSSYSRLSTSGYWPNSTVSVSGATLDFTGTTLTIGPVAGAGGSIYPVLFTDGTTGPLAAYLGIHGASFLGIPLNTGDSMTFETGGLHMSLS